VWATSWPPSTPSGAAASSIPSHGLRRDDNLRAELEQRGYGTVIGWTDEMPH